MPATIAAPMSPHSQAGLDEPPSSARGAVPAHLPTRPPECADMHSLAP